MVAPLEFAGTVALMISVPCAVGKFGQKVYREHKRKERSAEIQKLAKECLLKEQQPACEKLRETIKSHEENSIKSV